MRLKDGARKERSWFVFALFVLGGLTLLPGAAWTWAQDQNQKSDAVILPQPDLGRVASKSSKPLQSESAAVETVRVYLVADALKRIKQDEKCDDDQAKLILKGDARSVITEGKPSEFPENKIQFMDDSMIVRTTDEGHRAVANLLQLLVKYGLEQVVIETRFFGLSSNQMEKIDLDWREVVEEPSKRVSLVATLPEETMVSLMKQLQGDLKANSLMAPKVTMFNGRKAVVSCTLDSALHEFAMGRKKSALEPSSTTAVLTDAVSLQMTPEIMGDEALRLTARIDYSQSFGSTGFTYRTKKGVNQVVQPAALSSVAESSVSLPKSSILAIAVPHPVESNTVLLTLIKPFRLSDVVDVAGAGKGAAVGVDPLDATKNGSK